MLQSPKLRRFLASSISALLAANTMVLVIGLAKAVEDQVAEEAVAGREVVLITSPDGKQIAVDPTTPEGWRLIEEARNRGYAVETMPESEVPTTAAFVEGEPVTNTKTNTIVTVPGLDVDDLLNDADDLVEKTTNTIDQTVKETTDTVTSIVEKTTDELDELVDKGTDLIDDKAGTDTGGLIDDTVDKTTDTVNETVKDTATTVVQNEDETTDTIVEIEDGVTDVVEEIDEPDLSDSVGGLSDSSSSSSDPVEVVEDTTSGVTDSLGL